MNKPDIKTEKRLLKEAIKRGFKKGISYYMRDEKYKIKGDLVVRKMFKFAQGTNDYAFDYYVINHKNSNGYIYDGKKHKWATIVE